MGNSQNRTEKFNSCGIKSGTTGNLNLMISNNFVLYFRDLCGFGGQ